MRQEYRMRHVALGCLALVTSACATPNPAGGPTGSPSQAQRGEPAGLVPGYLSQSSLTFGRSMLPPPPSAGSAAQAADDEAYRQAVRSRGTPRWDLAARDAEWLFPGAAGAFSCAAGIRIGETSTPRIYSLLRRTYVDAGLAAHHATATFTRSRPFLARNDPICTPALAGAYQTDPSYPSGEAAIGWAWALVLSEIFPHRGEMLARRGYQYGQSALICGVRWQSDLDAGRLVGAMVVARLHGGDEYLAHLRGAREEAAAIRPEDLTAECAAEAEALK